MKRIVSLMLCFVLSATMSLQSFAMNDINGLSSEFNKSDADRFVEAQFEYGAIVYVEDTKYGPMYYLDKNATDIRPRFSFWDLTDIIMAGASWADLFNNPSWGNFGWAVLDTAALLPLLPSSAYVRKGGKVILNVDEVAKFAKTSKGKKAIKAAMTTYKFSDGIGSKAAKVIGKKWKGKEAKKVLEAFKTAADKGFVSPKYEEGIVAIGNAYKNLDKKYTHKIKLLGKYGDYRLLGYKDEAGKWIWDKLATHKKIL